MTKSTSLALVTCGLVAGCSVTTTATDGREIAPPEEVVVADLRADSNRDGEIRFDDDSDVERDVWDQRVGAIFFSNIDDDEGACKKSGGDLMIATCNDAVDDVVNGEDDALDLARLRARPWPDAPDETTAQIVLEPESAWDRVRLFKRTGEGAADFTVLAEGEGLTLDDLKTGVELGIEAKDILRDADAWDGYVDVKLVVASPKGDAESSVKMRVAPVLTFHHLEDATEVFVSNTRTLGNLAMRSELAAASRAAEGPTPTVIPEADPWIQDFFETGYMSMPAPGGAQHIMRVNYRSANVVEPKSTNRPLRPAGQLVFRLRGKDVAAVQEFDAKHDQAMDSLNSFGNWETIPPYSFGGASFPLGRVLRGSTPSFYPDKAFTKMIDAQKVQPAIDIDTSWLLVGHVDETLSFTHSSNARGWVLLVNDARLAKKMLDDAVAAGQGDAPMFVGKAWFDWESGAEVPAEITISQVLADTEVMRASAEAVVEVDSQLATLQRELGLTEEEIVRVPFLHTAYDGLSVAYQPGTVNGIYVNKGHFIAPDPHGPVIDGHDIFKKALEDALAPHGVSVEFIEDWEYHVGGGEVHCGTNAARAIPKTKWWESGR